MILISNLTENPLDKWLSVSVESLHSFDNEGLCNLYMLLYYKGIY